MSQTHAALRKRLQAALGEEFTVGEPLGEGGFAVVFKAHDNALSRDVAVKVLDLKLAPSPNLAERFVREARTVARLEHPHIVPIHKVGGRGEVLYLIMRYVDGPSLRQLLAKQGKLSVGDAARIARQVADALAYAHTHGIVHRDVKPDNVLLDRTGHVLVTDFGIAKAAAQAAQSASGVPLTTEGMILGTPHYMSPEQAADDPLDARSDIYSLGVVLYQMLAGSPPFDGESAQAILAQQLTADPKPIREVRGEVPEKLAFVLGRMLAKDPARRYPSAADVSRALVDVLPTAAHDRVTASPGRRLRRALGRVALVGLLVFVVGGAAVALTLLSESPAIAARGPDIPDSIVAALRRTGALGPGERPLAVFAPHGATVRGGLVVTGRSYVRPVAPRARAYPRARTEVRFMLGWAGSRGPRATVVLAAPRAAPDTLSRDLSMRELVQLLWLLRVDGDPDGR